ncbi:hypothetical protein [Mycobacterium sp. 852013-50091_SCH5140682]|uniref:hypothetical protein n=1 Tax=Mycobacterium sp. 852013-50091_SCH5140682 TaxID=1834109 RepID=UPI000B2D90B6|nr:hypothetical protein [Mycobacterium sp. 852013-50091_SCH5140682]
MNSDDDEDIEPDEQVGCIAEQLHVAYQDGYAAGIAAEKERRNSRERRNRKLRKLRPRRLR